LRLLLDTHALLWWFLNDPALSSKAKAALANQDAEVWVSAVSAIEIATKFMIGKLPQAGELASDFEAMVAEEGFKPLPITLSHAGLAGRLDFGHKDPFDRLLIAQALVEEFLLVSNEKRFDETGVARLW
jgi:PIN domain nuclease of toxin-antitoxin system